MITRRFKENEDDYRLGLVFWACMFGFWLAKLDSKYGAQSGLWLADVTKRLWGYIL